MRYDMLDRKLMKFGAEVMSVGTHELGASVTMPLCESLYAQWVSAGSPERKEWVRGKLRQLFPAVGARPRWVRPDCPMWPYHGPNPMTFLGQIDVPEFKLPTGHVSCAETLYIFGAVEGDAQFAHIPGAWRFIKKIVEQSEL
jgi:hypothetical protein